MPKLPVPREIACGSHTYKVVLTNKDTEQLADDGTRGEVNHRTMEVRINLSRSDTQKTEALIHEALHIAERVFASGEDMTERQTRLLSEALAQIIKGWGIEFNWDDVEC